MLIRLLIVALLAGCAPLAEISMPATAAGEVRGNVQYPAAHPAPAPAPLIPAPAMMVPPQVATVVAPPIAPVVRVPVRRAVPVSAAPVPIRVDAIAAQLKDATMVFDIPQFNNVRDSIRTQLTIDPTKTVDELLASAPSTSTVSAVQVSKVLEVKLVAPDFKIIAATPDRQAVSEWEPTVWKWELSGATPGKHDVHLSINAIVTIDGDRAERSVRTFEKTITIEITPAQQLSDLIKQYWQWIWTTLLLPAGMWIWKRFKRE